MTYKVLQPLKYGDVIYEVGSTVEIKDEHARPLLLMTVPPIKPMEHGRDAQKSDKKLQGNKIVSTS